MTVVRLPFRPEAHGFHFSNSFTSNFVGPSIRFDGLCGGMVLGAFNYFRYGLPIPPHINDDIRGGFTVDFEILRTLPGTTDVVDYIFHSQVATLENISIVQFVNPFEPSFSEELRKVRARIDRGQYLILGMRMRPTAGGLGHQVLCYGYDTDAQAAIVYDPNNPDREVQITAARSGSNDLVLTPSAGPIDERFKAMFEQQELFADRVSDRVTYDGPDNVARNLNFAVRPPLVNVQDGWRWCSRCEGLWHAGNGSSGRCAAGGSHVDSGSERYVLPMNYRRSSGQPSWRWCRKCEGLFHANGSHSGGRCPEGGAHDGSSSADYTAVWRSEANVGFAQDNWRWCSRCQGMHYARPGVCPASGGHSEEGSGRYVMLQA